MKTFGVVVNFEDVLAVMNVGEEVSGEEVGHVTGVASGSDVVGSLRGTFVVEGGISREEVGEVAHEGVDLSGRVGLFLNFVDLANEARVVLGNVGDVDAVESFDFDLDGGIGLAADLFDFDEGTGEVEVVGCGVIMVIGFLGDDDEAAVGGHGKVEGMDGAGSTYGKVDDGAWEDDDVLEGQEGKLKMGCG